MSTTKRWTVVVDIESAAGRTRAVARLHQRESDNLVAVGTVNLDPIGMDVPEIGDDLATAQALAALSGDLRELAERLADSAGRRHPTRGRERVPGPAPAR